MTCVAAAWACVNDETCGVTILFPWMTLFGSMILAVDVDMPGCAWIITFCPWRFCIVFPLLANKTGFPPICARLTVFTIRTGEVWFDAIRDLLTVTGFVAELILIWFCGLTTNFCWGETLEFAIFCINLAFTNCWASFDETNFVVLTDLKLFLFGVGFEAATTVTWDVAAWEGAIVVTIRCWPATDTMLFCETTANCATGLPVLLAIWKRFGWPGFPDTLNVVPRKQIIYYSFCLKIWYTFLKKHGINPFVTESVRIT